MAQTARKIVVTNAVRQQLIQVQIGLSRSGDQILSGMRGINVTPNAENMIRSDEFKNTILPEPKQLTLLCCEVGDLFSRPPSETRLWEKVARIGNLCPAEGAPRARVKFRGDASIRYRIIMNPINNSIFCLDSSGIGESRSLWLIACRTGVSWPLRTKIIFAEK